MKSTLILLAFVALSASAQSTFPIEWVKKNHVDLDYSFGMQTLIQRHEVQLIGLGEASHGQGSFFKHKVNSFKWLVENANYKIFALEAGFSEALTINQYVLYGKGNAEDVLGYLDYGVWEVKEFIELIEWMRAYNEEKPVVERVKFYGFDCQMAKGGVEYLKSIQGSIDYDFSTSDLALLENLRKVQFSGDKRLAKQIASSLSEFEIRVQRKILESNQDETFKKTSYTVLMNLKYFCDTRLASNRLYELHRSKYMAENIEHILDIEGDSTRMVLSAHNGHISKFPRKKDTGYWLKMKYGTKYYAIGYEFDHGATLGFDFIKGDWIFRDLVIESAKRGSFGYVVSKAVGQDCFIDFSGTMLPKWFSQKQSCSDLLGCYGQKGCNQRYDKIILAESYDGAIYIEETEAAVRM